MTFFNNKKQVKKTDPFGFESKTKKVSLDVLASVNKSKEKPHYIKLFLLFLIFIIIVIVSFTDVGVKIPEIKLTEILSTKTLNNDYLDIIREEKEIYYIISSVESNKGAVNMDEMFNQITSAQSSNESLTNYGYFLNDPQYDSYITYATLVQFQSGSKSKSIKKALMAYKIQQIANNNNLPLGFFIYNKEKNKSFLIMEKYPVFNKNIDYAEKSGLLPKNSEIGCYMYSMSGNYMSNKYILELVRSSDVIPYTLISQKICDAFMKNYL